MTTPTDLPPQPVVASKPLVVFFAARTDPQPCRELIEAISKAVNAGCREVHLLMRSSGGMIEDAMALYNTLRSFPVKLVTYNTYNIASMGVVVFLAGDERHAGSGSAFFLHRTQSGAQGGLNVGAARGLAKEMATTDQRIIAIMAERTGADLKTVEGWLDKETTFEGPEAVAVGLVQTVGSVELPPIHELAFVM
ncbi:MAG: ATP-dependent Clp protease proteolytic subunit [Acidimicrobiales bacterium]|jgi:ATP-dependent protease ClpP protease subunit